MRILCTICARGRSRGVPNKNIRYLNGKPLIAYTIEQAFQASSLTSVIVSTDCKEIAEVARNWGAKVPFLRPAELAQDESPKLPVITHALRWMEDQEGKLYNLVVDLDPTSPLRAVDDIEGSIQTLIQREANVVISVSEAKKNPYFNMIELNEQGWGHLSKQPRAPIARRQDAPKVYAMNASIYVFRRNVLLERESLFTDKTAVWVMPDERSIDIDGEIDFTLVELLLQKSRNREYDAG